jgi:hypothetical protein
MVTFNMDIPSIKGIKIYKEERKIKEIINNEISEKLNNSTPFILNPSY